MVKQPVHKPLFMASPLPESVIYGGGQLAASLLLMVLGKWTPAWLAVLVYAAMLGAAVIGLVSADAVVETIHVKDQKLKKDVAFMRSLQSKTHQLAAQCDSAEVKAFCENVRYSDPVSSEALAEIERDLSAAVDDLQAAVVDGDSGVICQLARKADTLLSERNRVSKLNK